MMRYVFRPASRRAQMGHGPGRNATAMFGDVVEVDEAYAAYIDANYAGVDGAKCLVAIGEPVVIEVIAPEPEHVPDAWAVDVLPVVDEPVGVEINIASIGVDEPEGVDMVLIVGPQESEFDIVADAPAIVPEPDDDASLDFQPVDAVDVPEPEAPAFAESPDAGASVAPAPPVESVPAASPPNAGRKKPGPKPKARP